MTTKHVFICGAGRSGTKILRDCLGSASDVACIPYDVGFVWRSGNESIPHDELLPADLSEKNIRVIRSTINRLGRRSSKNTGYRVILEKSVPNSLRPLVLKTVFPDSRIIHLVRDGRNTIESSMRNWKKPSDTGYILDKLRYFPLRSIPYALWYAKNKYLSSSSSRARLWGPRYEGMQADANELGLLEVCTKQWMKCVDVCDDQLALLPAQDVFEIKYEDFVSDVASVQALCDFAEISDVDGVRAFFRRSVRPTQGGKRDLTSDQTDYINTVARKTLSRHEYL